MSIGTSLSDEPGIIPTPNTDPPKQFSETTMDFLGETWVMVTMGVILLALIGLMIFLRMRPKDED